MKKKALITGGLGQDGSYMAELLLSKGYDVCCLVRHYSSPPPENGIDYPRCDLLNKKQLSDLIIAIQPDEIYNFAGVSNVFNAWDQLDYLFALNVGVPQHILETIKTHLPQTKFFQASSCLIFGRDGSGLQNETTPANPIHPYGASKQYIDSLVKEFRTVFGLFACSGILFSHESERRGADFFSKKVISTVARIKSGSNEKLKVGNLGAYRDYSYAPDVVEAAFMMLQNKKPVDYVIGSGRLITMEKFVEKAFEQAGLKYKDHIEFDPTLFRANDTKVLKADIRKITTELGWTPKHSIDQIIEKMGDYELEKLKTA